MPRILVVDKDPAIRLLLRRRLTKAGSAVEDIELTECMNGACLRQFDLLILDIDPPGEHGAELIRRVRDQSQVPIVALSVRGDEDATIVALRSGADDFVRKPFGIEELLARVENALRRRARQQGQYVRVSAGTIEIDLWHRRVYAGGSEIHLPAKEHEVLRLLAENADRVVAHDDILTAVWGDNGNGRLSYLRMMIRALRRKLEPDPARPRHILTETRIGYRLQTRSPADHPNNLRSVAS